MNESLVPANTKKSLLVLGFLRPMPDLLILVSGIVTSVSLLGFFGSSSNTWLLLIFCLPMLICGLLVMPIPNYHNTLCALQSITGFYNKRKNYIWRGWCIYNEFKDNKNNK